MYLRLTSFIFFTIFSLKLSGQGKPYINYTTHDGLPQIQVQFLHQDQKGYIWIGTKGGLSKFNGETFQNFLKNQYIYRIEESADGDIYIVTRKGIFQYEFGQMNLIHKNTKPTSVLADNESFWLFDNNSIHEVNNNKDTIQSFNTDILFTHFTHFNFFDINKKIPFLKSQTKPNVIQYVDNKELKSIIYDHNVLLKRFENGSVYVVLIHDNGHVKAQDPLAGKVYFEFDFLSDTIHNLKIYDLPVEKHLFYFGNYKYYTLFKNKTYKKIDFPFIKQLYNLITDKDDNYWAATDNGLYQIGNSEIEVFPRDYINDLWTLIQGKDGNFYGAEYNNALFKLDFSNQTKTELPVFQSNGKREKEFYYGASQDGLGNLYFPTQNGVYKYDYISFKKLDNGICLITKYDSISNQIIAGQEKGLAFFDKNGIKTNYIDQTGQIIFSRPTDFLFKQQNEIWIGSWENLAVFNRDDKSIVDLESIYPGGPQEGVIAMDMDYNNNIWLGGTDGLWFYNTKEKHFQKIKPDVFKSYILDVKCIDNEYLIMGTSHEIYILNLQDFYNKNTIAFKMYNYRNGFIGEEIAQVGFYLSDRKLYIPSTTFTSVIDIDKIDLTQDYFDVYITSINEKGLNLSQQTGEEIFELPKCTHNVEIEYETVGFGLPTTSKYQYILENVDKKWSDWSEKQKVSYANLSSGTYEFKVRVLNGSYPGEAITKVNSMKFKVSLPFYMEPNFYKYAFFITVLLTMLALYFIWKNYQQKLDVQNREKQIKLLEISTLQAQINPHFIFNFLSSIQSLIIKKTPEKANEYLVKFSRLMRNYMESSIKSTNILKGDTIGNENTINEEIELLKMYLDLESMKYPDGKITYNIQYDKDKTLNKMIPPMILQPFVENAIKHGILPKQDNGHIDIYFEENDNDLICTISDDGIGRILSEELKKEIINIRKSRGLELIKKRVEMLNQLDFHIKIDFIDPENGGTIVKIYIQ